MARKVARQKGYDVAFVGAVTVPVSIARRETDAVRTALKRPPSPEFLIAFRHILATYGDHRKAVARSTPAAIERRIEAVADGAKKLQKAISDLDLTDEMLVSRIVTSRYLGTGAEEFEERLGQFIAVFEQARKVVAKELKQGRMPAFAERALAQALCQILFEETGVVPTSKKGGSFDQLLRIALDHFSNGRPRKDVADLMRSALSEKPTLRYLLKLLNTEKWSPQEL